MYMLLKTKLWKASIASVIVSLLLFSIALAASGDLDTTFSGDGKLTTDFGGLLNDVAFAIAIQQDGKIVVVGHHDSGGGAGLDFAIARYKPNGALDTTFSGDGKLTTNFKAFDYAQGVAIQSDGKIIVSGLACNTNPDSDPAGCNVAIARYNANGTLDTTFSGDGKQMSNIGGLPTLSYGGLAIQSNGKIVVAGQVDYNTANHDFAVFRFNINGSLDTTFSGDGKARIGFGSTRQGGATDLVLQDDGKIVVGGFSGNDAETNCYMAVARLTSAGALDTTFSGDGRQTVNFGGTACYSNNSSIALDGSGRIVLGGYKSDGTVSDFAAARLTSGGALDTTFSGDGKLITNLPGDFAIAAKVRIVDDKIVLAGRSNPSGSQDFTVVRYNSNGSLDTTFSGDGIATFDFFGDNDVARGMAVDGNGKYVLVGQATINAQFDFGVVRILP